MDKWIGGFHRIRNRTRERSLVRVPSEYTLFFLNGHVAGHYTKMRKEALAHVTTPPPPGGRLSGPLCPCWAWHTAILTVQQQNPVLGINRQLQLT